jgi:hypothetical protein
MPIRENLGRGVRFPDAPALAALAMLVGYCTRLATFVVWMLVLSIQHRNMLAINAGDILLHLLLSSGASSCRSEPFGP